MLLALLAHVVALDGLAEVNDPDFQLFNWRSGEFTRRFDRDIDRYIDWVIEQRPDCFVILAQRDRQAADEAVDVQVQQGQDLDLDAGGVGGRLRRGDTIELVLNLVAEPVRIEQPRRIVIGFQATPVKPLPADWRT